MSMNVTRSSPSIEFPTPNFENIAELQEKVLHELETEAESLPQERRQQFLAGVRQHAGDILKFLDYVEKKGESTLGIKAMAKELFNELKTVGTEFAKATEANHQQFMKEMSVYNHYKDFHVNFIDLHQSDEHTVPTFTELLGLAQLAHADAQVRENFNRAKLTAGLVRSVGTVLAGKNQSSPAQFEPQKSKAAPKAVKINGSPVVYRCFNQAGQFTASVPATEIPIHKDVYFHATDLSKAKQILSAEKIKRLDLGLYRGVFVSSKPELHIGAVVFALNRSIESGLVLNAQFDSGAHWVGFSNSIPVNVESLEYIAVDQSLISKNDISLLAAQFSQAAGREIPIKSVHEVVETIQKRQNDESVCVPEGWPLTCEYTTLQSYSFD